MTTSWFPRNYNEMAQTVAQARRVMSDPSTPPTLLNFAKSVLSTVLPAWQAAYDAWSAAKATERKASAEADTANASFDAAFRKWLPTVRATDGRSLTHEIAVILGIDASSTLLELRYREKVTRARGLLTQIATRAGLGGDATLLAEFKAAVDALEGLVTLDEASTQARLTRGAALSDAKAAYNVAYAKYVRFARGLLGDDVAAALLPRFQRRDPRGQNAAQEGGGANPE